MLLGLHHQMIQRMPQVVNYVRKENMVVVLQLLLRVFQKWLHVKIAKQEDTHHHLELYLLVVGRCGGWVMQRLGKTENVDTMRKNAYNKAYRGVLYMIFLIFPTTCRVVFKMLQSTFASLFFAVFF